MTNKREVLNVFKIGGNIINDEQALDRFLTAFADLPGKKMLVHGGGRILDVYAERSGVEQEMIDGRRITNTATMELATMVYGGLVNKKMVAALQAKGINALGLTGADANVLCAEKRPAQPIDFGWVGDLSPEGVHADFLQLLLEQQICPVFCSITHDRQGHLFNTNADTLASSIAIALQTHYRVKLNYCFEKNGVLQDPEDNHSALEQLTPAVFATLKASQKVNKGMIPKLDNAFAALDKGVDLVRIMHADHLSKLLNTSTHVGTELIRQ